jgi:hypothetical protein
MKKLVTRIAALAAALTLAACGGSHDANTAQVRELNAVADAEPLTLTVDDAAKATAVALGSTSGYAQVDDGTHDTKVLSSTNATVLLDKSIGFNDGGVYTVVPYGRRAAIQVTQISDTTTDAPAGMFKVRLADFALDAGVLDLYVVASDITATPATISAVSGGFVTDFVQVAAGTYIFVLTTSGTKEVVFQSAPQAIGANSKLTFAALPALGAKLTNATLLSPTSSTYMPNPSARVKAINAVTDAQALTFKSDAATLLLGVPFGGASSYVVASTGTHTLAAELSNVPGTAIASTSRALDPARDYTVAAVGTAASPALAVIADDNSVPPAGYAKVRFGNLAADGISVDGLINFASRASAIAARNVSDSYPVPGATNYTLTFATPGGVSIVASIDSGILDSGGIYTVYLMGTAASPLLKVVRDR